MLARTQIRDLKQLKARGLQRRDPGYGWPHLENTLACAVVELDVGSNPHHR